MRQEIIGTRKRGTGQVKDSGHLRLGGATPMAVNSNIWVLVTHCAYSDATHLSFERTHDRKQEVK